MVAPNRSLPFEIMCDASDFDVGAVLGHVVSKRGIEVARAKLDVIVNLPPLRVLESYNLFLGMLVFTGDSSKISLK